MGANNQHVLSSNVANKLKKKIIDGEWKKNERIPIESELSSELMVSRTTVREAVKLLVSQNIVRIERGKGTFVAETPGVVNDPFGFEFVPGEILIKDLCDFRLAIEPIVCEIAVHAAAPEQLEEMDAIIKKMERIEKRLSLSEPDHTNTLLDDMADMDAAFHALLYHMTQNIVFKRMIPIIDYIVFESYLSHLYRNRKQRLKASDSHKALYLAIKNRESHQAYEICRQHMQVVREDCCGPLKQV